MQKMRLEDQTCDVCDGSVSSDFGEYPMGSYFWHKPISMWRRRESYNVVPPTCVSAGLLTHLTIVISSS